MLLTTDAVGGVWRYTLDLARALTDPVIAVLGPAPSAAQREEAAGIRLVETGLELDWTAQSPAALTEATTGLRELAAREGVGSVHLHAPALAGGRRWDVPVVAVAHSCVATWWASVHGGALPEDLAWRAELTGAGLRTADAVIAPTRAHAEATQLAYGGPEIAVVHNGTSGRRSCSGGSEIRGGILTAGRLWDEGKNAAALDRVGEGLPIRAAGPVVGPNGASVDLPNLELLGTLGPAAMRRAYAGATVFASLARYEPFGLSVLEAAQAGLRLVLSDIPSFRELWDGVACFVPLDSDPAPPLRQALAGDGDGGAAERAGHYTIESMVAGTLAVHQKIGARA